MAAMSILEKYTSEIDGMYTLNLSPEALLQFERGDQLGVVADQQQGHCFAVALGDGVGGQGGGNRDHPDGRRVFDVDPFDDRFDALVRGTEGSIEIVRADGGSFSLAIAAEPADRLVVFAVSESRMRLGQTEVSVPGP